MNVNGIEVGLSAGALPLFNRTRSLTGIKLLIEANAQAPAAAVRSGGTVRTSRAAIPTTTPTPADVVIVGTYDPSGRITAAEIMTADEFAARR